MNKRTTLSPKVYGEFVTEQLQKLKISCKLWATKDQRVVRIYLPYATKINKSWLEVDTKESVYQLDEELFKHCTVGTTIDGYLGLSRPYVCYLLNGVEERYKSKQAAYEAGIPRPFLTNPFLTSEMRERSNAYKAFLLAEDYKEELNDRGVKDEELLAAAEEAKRLAIAKLELLER